MRIALYHNLPSGGAKRTLYEAIKRLALEHEIDAYTLTSANSEFADIQPFVDKHIVYSFQPGTLFDSPFGRFNQLVRLADLARLRRLSLFVASTIEKNGYDALLVHPCQFEKAPSLLTFVKQVPTVYYCHESLRRLYEMMPSRPYEDVNSYKRRVLNRLDPLPSFYHAVLKRVDRGNIHRATKVLVNSQFTQEMICQIYAMPSEVSYHGVDTEWFCPLNVEKRPYLLSVGSLTPMKGFDFLIEAIGYISENLRPPLVIASNFQNPLEREYLEAVAQEHGVDLRLEGNVTEEKLRHLYNESAFTVYSPVREPFGLVPLESMACGTAVVAVREGGMQETIIHEKTGLLVDRDPIKFAKAVEQLLVHPEIAAEYGRSGRQHVLQNWTWEHSVQTLLAHLNQVVEGQ